MKRVALIFIFFLIALSACSKYEPKPLVTGPTFSHTLPSISKENKILEIGPWTRPATQSTQGFSIDQIAALAVLNNPDLKLARADAGIAHAQAFSASLLPDPQFNYNEFFTKPSTDPDVVPKWFTYGLTYDTSALLLRSLTLKQTKAAARQADLNLLWQEWQVISQARVLYVKTFAQNRILPLLEVQQKLLAERYQNSQKSLEGGNNTLEIVNGDLSAFTDSALQLTEQKRQLNQLRHDLNSLLGLAMDVEVPLYDQLILDPLNNSAIEKELNNLLTRRPDLLALKAGYESQDVRYRQAIWSQFPGITLGYGAESDNTGIKSGGFSVNFSLPIFNRNQGNIAIEKATRQKLYDEFESRVNYSDNDVRSLLKDQQFLEAELKTANEALPSLKVAAHNADQAYYNGDIDEPTYRGFKQSYLLKEIDAINLEQAVLMQRIALQTLLGGELPVVKS